MKYQLRLFTLSLLVALVLTNAGCLSSTYEERMKDAHTAAMMIAPDLGIAAGDLISEEENCDSTGCYQLLYFSSSLTDVNLDLRLSSSKIYSWTYGSTSLNFPTDSSIDLFAKRIIHIAGTTPVNTPAREWHPTQFLTVNKKRYIQRVALYLTSSIPLSYTIDGKPLQYNVLRVYLKT